MAAAAVDDDHPGQEDVGTANQDPRALLSLSSFLFHHLSYLKIRFFLK
jgi:hypothetical protein